MKFESFKTDERNGQPSELASRYIDHVRACGTLNGFLQIFDFSNADEINDAIIKLYYTILFDPFLQDNKVRASDAVLQAVYKKAANLINNEGRLEKLAAATSQDLWHKYFAPRIREDNYNAMFGTERDDAKFGDAVMKIMKVYNLGYAELEKLQFFVEMVKARDKFPPSLRRMLYIWGRGKKTGKTTVAKMLTSLLNGSTDWEKADPEYTTTLANEMQIGVFKVPKIASCECCMMDECFYSDMGKTYHDFKRYLTSSGGQARLPYGQTFQWSGRPNYVATSNEPLSTFIKDWDDRRFLSVEFKSAPLQLSFDEVFEMWRDYVINSTTKYNDFAQWANEIATFADEQGERETLANEYEVELQKRSFALAVEVLPTAQSATAPDNRVTLKWFVDYFAEREGLIAQKRRKEIEKAVITVFGDRHHGYNWWRLDKIRERCSEIQQKNSAEDVF